MPESRPQIRTRLREETRALHERTERLPFFAALRTGELALDGYRGYLVALRIVLRSASESLGSSEDPRLELAGSEEGFRLHDLRRDLSALEARRSEKTEPSDWGLHPRALLRAHVLAHRIRTRAVTAPLSLLGTAYVLHGSVMGAPTLGGWARRAFDLERETDGVGFLSPDPQDRRDGWERFLRGINELDLAPEELEVVVSGAIETFEAFGEIVGALHPPPEDLRSSPVQELNPEAGDHAVTVDPDELEAALRAGEASWRRFPYYRRRYGDRGAAFTRSDSAWLVTLSRAPADTSLANVLWLSRLLASRGMPRWLMEEHLGVLLEELLRRTRRPETDYRNLALAREALREMRTAHLDDEVLLAVARAFDEAVGPEWAAQLPDTGALLAAAVADEADGVPGAVSSLSEWMTSSGRFPPEWTRAVREAISTARHRIRG